MIKKIFALASLALVSFNASAGYVSYQLTGGLSGTIIQNDVTKAIVDFNLGLYIPGAPTPYPFTLSFSTNHIGEGSDRLGSETTHFLTAGPTNFTLQSDFGADQFTTFSVDFAKGAAGTFSFSGDYRTAIYFTGGYQNFSGSFTGGAQLGTVNPVTAQYLADNHAGDGVIVPYVAPVNAVPEPAGLALFAVGMLGIFGQSRRVKKSA